MHHEQLLLTRLDGIGRSLAATGHALALIGLGSVGKELDRLDRYSDLDFFVIAQDGYKQWFLEDLTWLSNLHPIAYHFRNTADGYKLFYADGIFCEFAIFERGELSHIPFAAGRVVWKMDNVDNDIASPAQIQTKPESAPTEWLIGEALTNLYVGLGRYHRGEKLTAARFIQQYAVDRVLELAAQVEPEQAAHKDHFAFERRYEQRFPRTAELLPTFIQGYERSRESADAILGFLEQHFDINVAMARVIRALC